MRIAVLGAGAMGSLIGAYLTKGGQDVCLIDPYEEHMKIIRTDGLTLHVNNTTEMVRMKTCTSADEMYPFDVIVVLVKGMLTKTALVHAKNIVDENTYLLTLQNGLGNAEVMEEFTDSEHILKGVMKIASHLEEPGSISSMTMPGVTSVYLGCHSITEASEAVAQELEKAFNNGGLLAEYEKDIDFYIWSKAVNNISINAVCGIARTSIQDFLNTKSGWRILEGCVKEVVRVANALKVPLKIEDVIDSITNNTLPKIGSHLPSLAQDIKAKKLTEISTLNGAISDYGHQLEIATPINDLITDMIRVIENNYTNQF